MKTKHFNILDMNSFFIASLAAILFCVVTLQASAQSARHSANAVFSPLNGTALAFGDVPIGQAVQKTFSFANTGKDTLIIQSLELSSDSGFTIQFASLVLPPSGQGKVVVQFAPTDTQTYSTTISFAVAGGVASPTLTLTGNGSRTRGQESSARAFDTTAMASQHSGGAERKELR